MLRTAILVLFLGIVGCSSYKPIDGYPQSGANGFSETKLGKESFLVRVDGNTNESYEILRYKLLRRSVELCPGSFTLTKYTMKRGFVIHAKRVHWPYVTANLTCTSLPIDKSVLFENEV
ncbi:hypothetical protein N476_24225 [Pseudoalteromonas luteoviolacea H33]|uniref:Lipoprotein n=1 Tax=Pseudoalteromonas luteoviolacea H33 TaxID=1365251 RepID=A0A167BKU7_9GAMM|nr:hypothetical protein N476_24225 [Pseudoalteromonas luteoviolacea H33]KZN76852.1 hypothetical protein N477_01520 [Pseudoalteromonas luteoviolacea H33-S]